MAWRQVKVFKQKCLFIKDCESKKSNFASLCRHYGISRPTGYKWLDRHARLGIEGLKELDRTPFNSPTETCEEKVKSILSVKYKFSTWGPVKVLKYLQKNFPDIQWPSETTVENILKKNGLVSKRKRINRVAQRLDPLGECHASNDIWCFDFKGSWLTNEKEKCEPFTLMDAQSRFLLCCENLKLNDNIHVWAIFERLFREYGLPLRVRSDNGPPFATVGAGRLSRVSINLIKAGVMPEWIDPGEPQQNGRHERMHRTLKQECVDPSLSLKEQLKKLDEFTYHYNFVRPHAAIEHKCPGDIYVPSSRQWNGLLRSPEYPKEYKIGNVQSCGKMSWKGEHVYVGRVFEGEPIGIKVEEEILKAYYGPIFLGNIKGNTLEIPRRSGRYKRKV